MAHKGRGTRWIGEDDGNATCLPPSVNNARHNERNGKSIFCKGTLRSSASQHDGPEAGNVCQSVRLTIEHHCRRKHPGEVG